MANCKRIEPVQPEYELALTTNEAEVLMAILRKVGGVASETDRGACDKIQEALRGAGVKITSKNLSGGLTFS